MQHGEVSHGVKKKKRMRVRWKERRGNKVVQCEAQSWPSAASIFMSITSSAQHHVSEFLGHFHFPRRVTNPRKQYCKLPETTTTIRLSMFYNYTLLY